MLGVGCPGSKGIEWDTDRLGCLYHLSKDMLQCSRRPHEVYVAAHVVGKVAHDGHGDLVHLYAARAGQYGCVVFGGLCLPCLWTCYVFASTRARLVYAFS